MPAPTQRGPKAPSGVPIDGTVQRDHWIDGFELSPDGKHYILNGTKLWCTNGTLAELLVVMARNPKTKKISAFVVETAWSGVSIDQRCHFMGLRALANAVISFKDVRVPVGNLIRCQRGGLLEILKRGFALICP